MSARFREACFTPEVLAAQSKYYGRSQTLHPRSEPDRLGPDELSFIARRDSFYVATVSSDGWPYLQHRGGPAGFLKAIDPETLGFPDFGGNRQLISTGNLASSDRVALFLMDYPRRERLKILGHARMIDARERPDIATLLASTPEPGARVERICLIQVVAYDWNCPQHITPRYTAEEVEELVAPLRQRIAELEQRQAEARPPGQ